MIRKLSTPFSISCPADKIHILQTIEDAAAHQGRARSDLILWILEKYIAGMKKEGVGNP